jgi:hypothetical protein
VKIPDASAQAVGMQAEPEYVDRRLAELGIGPRHEPGCRLVGGDERPVPVDGESRVGVLCAKDEVDGGARDAERGIVERALAVHRRIPGRHQQRVAFAQRDRKLLGEVQEHVPARGRASRFEEAQMPLRNLGLTGEIELAQAAAPAPLTQQNSDMVCGAAHGSCVIPALVSRVSRARCST